jgi:RNA polymerase sigma-70 factor, ECF subfamily
MVTTTDEPTTVDESALVTAAQAGDMAAMEQLLARHQTYVDRLCRRMLHNPCDAEDARQDAWFQAAHRIATFDGRAAFRTWLHTVTKNVCLNKIRAAARADLPVADPDHRPAGERPATLRFHPSRETTPRPDDRVAARLDVQAALNELTPAYRETLVLWYVADLDYTQIAQALDININTVKSRLHRAKAELVERLRDLPGQPALA